MRQFVVSRDDCSFAVRVILRPTCSTEDLKNVEDTKINERPLLSIVDLGALNKGGRANGGKVLYIHEGGRGGECM